MGVSITDVARHCGLSTVTVSRVINRSGNVKEANRQRVLAAIEELGYTPNAAARSLVRGRTTLLGVVLSDLTNTYSNKVITALKNHLLGQGYLITLFMFDDIVREDAEQYILDEQRVDGFFVITPALETQALEKLARYRRSVVVLDRQMDNVNPPYIDVDDFHGGYLAAEHFLSLGHRRIGFINGPDMICCKDRKAGLCAGLAGAGLALYAETGDATYDYSVGYRAIRQWHEQGTVPTAILASCDTVATGAIDALLRRGYRIPEEVSVMGFDHLPLFQDYEYDITTIEQPVEEMAICAVEMMMRLLQGKHLEQEVVKLKPRLIRGNTTGRCRER